MLRPTRLLATAAFGGLGALSVGPAWAVAAAAPAHTTTTVAVVIDQDAYAPDPVSAFVGDTVTWTNADDIPHDVYGAGAPAALRSPMLSAGESWSYVPIEAGSFTYVCTIHEGMVGLITVAAHDDAVVAPGPDAAVAADVAESTAAVPPLDDPGAAPPVTEATAAPLAPAAAAVPVVAAPVTAPVLATVPEPSFHVELWLVGVALLAFALVAMALSVLAPERDG